MKRLEDMTLEELWQLFPITLERHDPRWKEWAEYEISSLKDLLGPLVEKIHHIGSTAVSGIQAKPIIDILIETSGVPELQAIKSILVDRGYLCVKERDSRIDLNKGYTHSGYAERVFHIHLRLPGDADEIYFRDYLNTHPAIAKEYEALKLSLWSRFEHDRDGYTEAKSAFVRYYTDIAKADKVTL